MIYEAKEFIKSGMVNISFFVSSFLLIDSIDILENDFQKSK
jgi:hypothetical protein